MRRSERQSIPASACRSGHPDQSRGGRDVFWHESFLLVSFYLVPKNQAEGKRELPVTVAVVHRHRPHAGSRSQIWNQAAPRRGSASCTAKGREAFAWTKACKAGVISHLVKRSASSSAISLVASRDRPSIALKATIRTG